MKPSEQLDIRAKQKTVTVTEIDVDNTDLTLGPDERKAIKQAFKDGAARLKEISDRAQRVAETDLEPEMYSNLASEACALTDGLRRLAWKGERLCRDDEGFCSPY